MTGSGTGNLSSVRSELVFLFSNEAANPDRFFQGYFFHESDYVFTERGFDAFRRARGATRPEREDGCYVVAERQQGGDYRFSADYSGFKKLFYFWDSGSWVVSNSLYRIAVHLRRHGYPVVPDNAQLAAMAAEGTFYPSGRGSFFSQLTCFDTVISGVRLVPADSALLIGPSGVRTEKVGHRHGDQGYSTRLEHFIGTWIGRLATLMREPTIRISADLTGGLDSRVVFALLLGALRSSNPGIGKRLQIRSSTASGARRDRAVAAAICRTFDLPLNGRAGRRQTWMNGETSYALWKDLCLGAYHPIYFPGAFPTGNFIHLGGGGGENHRPFYSRFIGAPAADAFVSRRARNIGLRSARAQFETALREAFERIMDGAPEHLDALACHYRHFRNRFHAGREPQYAVSFQPLASQLLDHVTGAAGPGRFRNAQVHYDILHSLVPELLDIPFDARSKRAGRGVRRRLTSVSAPPGVPGNCFTGDPRAFPEALRKRKGTPGAIDCLREDFSGAKAGFATEFLGKTYVERAERALEAAARDGYFRSPIQSKRVAVVMACAMFDA